MEEAYTSLLAISQKCRVQEMSLPRNTVDLCRNSWLSPWLTEQNLKRHESLRGLSPGSHKAQVQTPLQTKGACLLWACWQFCPAEDAQRATAEGKVDSRICTCGYPYEHDSI